MNNFIKYILTAFAFLILFSTTLEAQRDRAEEREAFKKLPLKERLVLGGNFGLGYANGLNLNISPTLGYRLTPDAIVGAGIIFAYYGRTDRNLDLRARNSSVGGRLFAQYRVIQNLYLRSDFEYERFRSTTEVISTGVEVGEPFSRSFPAWLAGAGYSTNFGRGLGMSIEALYDILYDPNISYYPSPWRIRVGAGYSFGG